MQCPNCQFHNMPGTQSCARCGTSLRIKGEVINIHPPRAGSIALRMRRWFPWSHGYFAVRDRWEAGVNVPLRSAFDKSPDTAVILRMVVPGWSQRYLGERRLGRILFWAWIPFIVLGLFLFGTTRGSMLLGLAFSIHSFAASHLLNRTGERDVGAQLRRSIFVSLTLAAFVYGPAAFLLTRLVDPVTPTYTIGPFVEGQTLAINHWATPDRGSVVLYDIPEYEGVAKDARAHRRVIGFNGQRIDRVIAIAGDSVECRSGVMLVNGKVTQYQPLMSVKVPQFAPFTVSPGHFLIIPSTTEDLIFTGDNDPLLRTMSEVPVERVRGIVYARLHPTRKFRLIY